MSVCIRTITNKLSLPFVGAGKPVSPVDRQLTKNLKKSTAFLDELFGSGAAAKKETRGSPSAASFVIKPLATTSDNVAAWNYKLGREKIWSVRSGENERFEDAAVRLADDRRVGEAPGIVFSVAERGDAEESGPPVEDEEIARSKPTKEQLEHVYGVLHADLPNFFIKPIDYKIYHPYIVFENNIRGTVTKGLYEYIKQTAMLRIVGHVKFAYVKFEVLKMTMHPEDDSIKVRWRIRGITGSKVFFTFWKYKLWNLQEAINQLDSWHDGFSTFYVNGYGKVTRHVADKVVPDQDVEEATKEKSGMAAKLALFLGLTAPRELITDISPLVSCIADRERSGVDSRKKPSVGSAKRIQ